ncbi:unnamed protein product [Adineta ricciae]|uniref:Uncharacterized protein n=1 Tax=Adineta ricciae TaxID=249248 RepID=A0A815NL45_ADIRI|nr:unnamed protein product [Adineta ricciae]
MCGMPPGVMSYLPKPMGLSQPRFFFPPTVIPASRSTRPWWSTTAAAGRIRSQTGGQTMDTIMPPNVCTTAEIKLHIKVQLLGNKTHIRRTFDPIYATVNAILENDNVVPPHVLESREVLKTKVG